MLQRKCEEIVNEMERLNKEAEQMDADQTAHAAYEKRYEELVQSVRELEGTLADHNLALDKARSGSDLSEQQRYCDMVKVRPLPLPPPRRPPHTHTAAGAQRRPRPRGRRGVPRAAAAGGGH